jgi:hypothetical protein
MRNKRVSILYGVAPVNIAGQFVLLTTIPFQEIHLRRRSSEDMYLTHTVGGRKTPTEA